MHVTAILAGLLALGVEQAQAAAVGLSNTDVSMIAARSHAGSAQHLAQRSLNCNGNIPHLTKADCEHLSQLGFTQHGVNADHNAGANSIWIGSDGKFKGVFRNTSGKDLILVAWNQQFGFGSSFVETNQARLTVSVAKGQSVTVSFADGANGAWSTIEAGTKLNNGQISNTWGEFSTGNFATVDVSREPNMSGNAMSIKTPAGCTSDMDTCVFVCKSGNICGAVNTYSLKNCKGPNTANGGPPDAPSGGCQGWSNGGALQVELK